MEWTPHYLARAEKEFSTHAGEGVRVEAIGGHIYAFGSELACLRLYLKYNGTGRCAFSQNLNSWYFSPKGVAYCRDSGARLAENGVEGDARAPEEVA